jgi:sugar-specific transcriptional regulator TrmB
MSTKALTEQLLDYGLTDQESQIYVYVAKRGPSLAGEISKALKIQRGQTYNILKTLQKKGIVEALASRPARFSATALPKALDILMQAHQQRQYAMEKARPQLLAVWESTLMTGTAEILEEKFQFLTGVESIYRKALEAIQRSRESVSLTASESALYHIDRLGVIDAMRKASRKNVDVKILAELTPRTSRTIAEMRRINIKAITESRPPNFLIADQSQIIFFTRPLETTDPTEATAVWTNSPTLVETIERVFEDMWSSTKVAPELPSRTRQVKEKALMEPTAEPVEALQNRFAKNLSAAGFDVRRNFEIRGDSGTAHEFSLAILQSNERPIVIDIEVSDQPIGSVRVIAFFAKRLDIRARVADGRLIVKPSLTEEAKRLAANYKIKFSELGAEWP